MKNMSFALTTDQVRNQTKTVTRRLGWKTAKVGDVVQPVVKGQGIPKGGTVERIGAPIRFVSVRRERLNAMLDQDRGAYGSLEAAFEGFPHHTAGMFVQMFCDHNDCEDDTEVTRIEFEYTEPKA